MLTWPHSATGWVHSLEQVVPVFATIGAAISQDEPLLSVCDSATHAADVRSLLLQHQARPEHLYFALAASDDSWARDYAPLVTLNGSHAVINDFAFNGYGNKYPSRQDDALTAALVGQGSLTGGEHRPRPLILEGGAIETDGAGSLLATRSTIMNGNRNHAFGQTDIERLLHEFLGFDRFLWLDHGEISGDDTDGHIDTLARFAGPDTILYVTAPPGDEDHAGLVAMADQLRGFRTRDGDPYRLVPLPFAGVHRDQSGRRLPATYANFLITNASILLPVYGIEADEEAVEILRDLFPARTVKPVDCRSIIERNGSLHCLTMQFPAAIGLNSNPGCVAK
jgi:agmatine/peptidylarginine deiminase